MDGNKIKQVQHFCYLETNISIDGRCGGEIMKGIATTKGAFNKIKHSLVDSNISLTARKRAVKTFRSTTITTIKYSTL